MDDYCKYIYYGAAQSGNLSLFKSMNSKGYPFNKHACKIAAENGHLEIVEWILAEIDVWRFNESEVYYDWIINEMCPAC